MREGDVQVVVVPTDPPTYRFDPAREREPRRRACSSMRRSSARPGRAEPWTAREEPVVVPGSRYIDWLIPGIIGLAS